MKVYLITACLGYAVIIHLYFELVDTVWRMFFDCFLDCEFCFCMGICFKNRQPVGLYSVFEQIPFVFFTGGIKDCFIMGQIYDKE